MEIEWHQRLLISQSLRPRSDLLLVQHWYFAAVPSRPTPRFPPQNQSMAILPTAPRASAAPAVGGLGASRCRNGGGKCRRRVGHPRLRIWSMQARGHRRRNGGGIRGRRVDHLVLRIPSGRVLGHRAHTAWQRNCLDLGRGIRRVGLLLCGRRRDENASAMGRQRLSAITTTTDKDKYAASEQENSSNDPPRNRTDRSFSGACTASLSLRTAARCKAIVAT
jgi:hypothetical protein